MNKSDDLVKTLREALFIDYILGLKMIVSEDRNRDKEVNAKQAVLSASKRYCESMDDLTGRRNS